MSKDLPKMYVNKIKKELHNNQNLFSSYEQNDGINNMPITKKEKEVTNLKSKYQIEQKIYNILNPSKYVYKADVHIAFKDGSLKEKKIIGYVKNNVITYDNEKISIDDIADLY